MVPSCSLRARAKRQRRPFWSHGRQWYSKPDGWIFWGTSLRPRFWWNYCENRHFPAAANRFFFYPMNAIKIVFTSMIKAIMYRKNRMKIAKLQSCKTVYKFHLKLWDRTFLCNSESWIAIKFYLKPSSSTMLIMVCFEWALFTGINNFINISI